MIQRLHVHVVPAYLALAVAAGAAMGVENCALAAENAAAQGQAAAAAGHVGGGAAGSPTGQVNVTDFSRLAADGDWSPAIQAAIDHVSAKNGFENGATIVFPPGTYRVNKTIRLGKDRTHSGVRLSGYGAVLQGTKTLDTQPLNYDERMKKATGEPHDAFPGELDFDGKTNVGVPILELWGPPDFEWANFVIEGLTFDREAAGQGVGLKIPAETVAKNVTFRDVKVYRQNVGVHVNYSWQIRFDSCQICLNQIGIWGRNHFNSVSIVNCEIRRQHLHGLVIGPYVYYADTGNFVFREFHVPSEDEALAERIRQAKRKLAIAAEEKDRVSRINAQVTAQMEIGDVLVSAGDFDRARVEYQQAFQYPAKDQLEWRSTIQTAIADSYMKQKKYREAAAAYEEAQKIGVYGWRVEHVKTNLKQAKDLAEREK